MKEVSDNDDEEEVKVIIDRPSSSKHDKNGGYRNKGVVSEEKRANKRSYKEARKKIKEKKKQGV